MEKLGGERVVVVIFEEVCRNPVGVGGYRAEDLGLFPALRFFRETIPQWQDWRPQSLWDWPGD